MDQKAEIARLKRILDAVGLLNAPLLQFAVVLSDTLHAEKTNYDDEG